MLFKNVWCYNILSRCKSHRWMSSSCHRLLLHQQLPFHQRNENELKELYSSLKKEVYENEIKLNPMSNVVFANNELSFRYLNSFGFDYDYTLAQYSDELHVTIYKMALDNLIGFGYPKEIMKYEYDPKFPVRGLHFDTENGYLMKIDSCNRVMLGSVYRGYQKMSDEEVVKEYGGTLINVDLISKGQTVARIFQQMDLFSMAFVSLLTNVIDYLTQKNIHFDPSYIFYDVDNATQYVHKSGKMHQAIIDDLDCYLPKREGLEMYMNRLLRSNKKLFLLTNSSFNFIDKGMTHLFHADWRELFEVVIVNARKPRFFTDIDKTFRPFRNINLKTGKYMWDHVEEFQRHGVYGEGNIKSFMKYTDIGREGVIYFGDHVYSDLMDPVLRLGWRTGAIIPELEKEMKICYSEDYVRDIKWLITLEHLISILQVNIGPEIRELLSEWRTERKNLSTSCKDLFNPYFGSMFRTHQNPSLFTHLMTNYADLYTSSIENFLNYNDEFHFLPTRNRLPHERF